MKCKNCKNGILEEVSGIKPYNENHLQCNICDSTYNILEYKNKVLKAEYSLSDLEIVRYFSNTKNELPNGKTIIENNPEEMKIIINFIGNGNSYSLNNDEIKNEIYKLLEKIYFYK